MDYGTISWLIWSFIVAYACFKIYKFGLTLNPYDFTDKKYK